MVSLRKGDKVSLEKKLGKVAVVLRWSSGEGRTDPADLDLSAFMLKNGRAVSEEHLIFYHNLTSPCGSVEHGGDSRVDGEEKMYIDIPAIPDNVDRIVIVASIYEGDENGECFAMVSDAVLGIYKTEPDSEELGEEILHFDLVERYSIETAVVVCEIYRDGADWKFYANGHGQPGGLESLCNQYDIPVE